MPSEIGNQSARSTGGAAPGAHYNGKIVQTTVDEAVQEKLQQAPDTGAGA